jgi:hypothetical protein
MMELVKWMALVNSTERLAWSLMLTPEAHSVDAAGRVAVRRETQTLH